MELACDVVYAGLVVESGIVCMSLGLQQALFTIMDEGIHVVPFCSEEIKLSLTACDFITLRLL